jgi:hypothetical protein
MSFFCRAAVGANLSDLRDDLRRALGKSSFAALPSTFDAKRACADS